MSTVISSTICQLSYKTRVDILRVVPSEFRIFSFSIMIFFKAKISGQGAVKTRAQ